MAASGIEVNLPDLPELSIGLGPDDGPRLTPGEAGLAHRRRPWGPRLRDALTTYLPFLLMVILALGSWWLVKNSPGAPKSTRAAVPAGVPDYTLHGFTLQRYGKDGRLMLTLHGRQLHHFPETDRIEIEEVRLLGELPSGGRAQATARRAVANNKANEVRLLGGAVVRGQNLDGQPVEIDSEYLLYNADTRLLTTDKPVVLTVGDSRTQAAGLAWNLDSRALELKPPVHATLQPRAQGLVSERVQAGPIAAAPRGNTGALTP